jgi:hypothetical protein
MAYWRLCIRIYSFCFFGQSTSSSAIGGRYMARVDVIVEAGFQVDEP